MTESTSVVPRWPGWPRTTGTRWSSCGSCEAVLTSTLRAEFFDNESRNWHFRGPAPRVNGGGAQSRADAEEECLAAIAFALEGDPADYDGTADAVSLDVSVEGPSAA